jgi:flagellar protein FliS
VGLLYDGALRFLAQAREKMEAGDCAAKGILLSRALEVIHELDGSLNMDEGGALAQNLHNLYFLCSARLLQANLKRDFALLDSVANILTGLRNAFSQILTVPEAQAASARIGAKHSARTVEARPLPSGLQGPSPRSAVNLYAQQNPPAPPPPPASVPAESLSAAGRAPSSAAGFAGRNFALYGKTQNR